MPIPRLELTAAVLTVKVACLLRKELQIDGLKERFWTDSQVVSAYIRSNSKRLRCLLLIVSIRLKKIQGLISGTMSQAKKILLTMLHEDMIIERKHLIVVGFMDHHSYGKLNHFGKVKTAALDH